MLCKMEYLVGTFKWSNGANVALKCNIQMYQFDVATKSGQFNDPEEVCLVSNAKQ